MSLLEVPGYELGMAAALAAVPAGIALGIRAARRERSRPAPRAARALLRAALPPALGQLVLFLGAAAWTALFTPCGPLAAAGLYWLTALPSALLAAALGTACGFATRGRRLAGLLAGAAAAGSLAEALARGYWGPSAALSAHLLGWWPGPIYDEALFVDRRLLLFRLGTLGWTAALAGLAGLLAGRPRRGPALLAAAGLYAALAARSAGGVEPSRAQVEAALGGALDGPLCRVRFPREWEAARAARLLADCESTAAAIARTMAVAHPPRPTVFVYRSPAEKRRLVGARHTSFTKPWLAEIHVNDEREPRPVLRHELVHAVASAFGPWPLRVPARDLVWVRAGLVEGLAGALEPAPGGQPVHEWARALRDLGLQPPPAALLGGAAFLAVAPARAYAASASFVAWLLEQRGPGPVKELYRTGDPAASLGEGLPALAAGWERFLDGVPVPPAVAAAAARRFRDPGLFGRACARETAAREEEARERAEVTSSAGGRSPPSDSPPPSSAGRAPPAALPAPAPPASRGR